MTPALLARLHPRMTVFPNVEPNKIIRDAPVARVPMLSATGLSSMALPDHRPSRSPPTLSRSEPAIRDARDNRVTKLSGRVDVGTMCWTTNYCKVLDRVLTEHLW
jgi:hypothetical protein